MDFDAIREKHKERKTEMKRIAESAKPGLEKFKQYLESRLKPGLSIISGHSDGSIYYSISDESHDFTMMFGYHANEKDSEPPGWYSFHNQSFPGYEAMVEAVLKFLDEFQRLK